MKYDEEKSARAQQRRQFRGIKTIASMELLSSINQAAKQIHNEPVECVNWHPHKI